MRLYLHVYVYVCVQLIKEGKQYDDLTEVAKLFNLHGADVVEDAEETQNTDEKATAA